MDSIARGERAVTQVLSTLLPAVSRCGLPAMRRKHAGAMTRSTSMASLQGDARLMTADSLRALHDFTDLPDGSTHDRLARPRTTSLEGPRLVRKHAVVVGAGHLPPLQLPPPPTPSLRGHTISEAIRVFPEARPSPLQFAASVSRLGLPLELAGSSSRVGRMGDGVHSTRVLSSLSNLRAYASAETLGLRSSTSMSSIPVRHRHGRALMISGGAPLHADTQKRLRMLHTGMLQSQSSIA